MDSNLMQRMETEDMREEIEELQRVVRALEYDINVGSMNEDKMRYYNSVLGKFKALKKKYAEFQRQAEVVEHGIHKI